MNRSEFIKKAKRIVIKVGTSIITTDTGQIDDAKILQLANQVSDIFKQGYEVLLVSSGSIPAGVEALRLSTKPNAIPELQACASVGQGLLVHKYSEVFKKNKVNVGQVLLTGHDIAYRQQYVNAKNTLNKLLELKVIPIINENDSTATDEIKFGDNDRLAAFVANFSNADLLIILSNVDGFYSADPKKQDSQIITTVETIDDTEIKESAGGPGTTFGKGGMGTKIMAAKIAVSGRAGVIIANGHDEKILSKIVGGEPVGTFFVPKSEKRSARKLWILNQPSKGTIFIDEGAEKAIREEGRSLLAVGVRKAEGDFDVGDAVKIKVGQTKPRLIKGIVNYNNREINKIAGKSTKEIMKILGIESVEEIVHRDEMAMMKLKTKNKVKTKIKKKLKQK